MILDKSSERFSIGRYEELTIGMYDFVPFGASEMILGEMKIDFIAIEISIEGGAVGVVETNRTLSCKRYKRRGGGKRSEF